LFGIPILGLILGLILIWLSKESNTEKLLATALPIPIILATFLIFFLSLTNPEPEIFLIPKNFRGKIAIYYNQNCGQPLQRDGVKRIFDVSQNIFFITSDSQTVGIINRKFYFVDENGNKSKIPEFHWTKFEDEKNDWHWFFSEFEITKNLVGFKEQKYSTNYQSYVISDYQSLENESKETRELKEKEFKILADTKLKECKNNY
jgi:hypothetical protein